LVNRFLKDKSAGCAEKTLRNYRTTLNRFAEFLDDKNIRGAENITSDDLQRFREVRLDEVAVITARQDMMTVKQLIRFGQHVGAVTDGLAELVRIPSVNEEDEVADEILTREEATAALDHLATYDYATARHVSLLLCWRTGIRISGLLALDLNDLDTARPALELRSRDATPLKNRKRSERDVAIREETASVLTDYIDTNRPDVTDSDGRDPLLASEQGRLSSSTVQRYIYTATRPCVYSGECPFGYSPETCDARSWNGSSKCPGSVSPHVVRAGYVTAALNSGQPRDVTGDRTDMGSDVLQRHYDRATREEKAERRRDHLRDV
jgi:site-specific recombinase XerD